MVLLDMRTMVLVYLSLPDNVVVISKLSGECEAYDIDVLLKIAENIKRLKGLKN